MKKVIGNLENFIFDKKTLRFLTYNDCINTIALTPKIKLSISSHMRSFDILRILLFRLYQKFQLQKDLFLYDPKSKYLHKINKNFNEFILYFMIFENVFEVNIQKKLKESLDILKI
ncbi:hypothetical protein, partial [Campylobacter sp.]|uniref:hypothetical protein n=1 Tax=Campylobacter sp. TaxID=205 RepID=UPI0025B992C1